jgi:histidinol phosphatase-like enzyme
MTAEISRNGGRIDRVYYSPFLENEHSVRRKPNVGMALQARKDLPGIRFKCSLMAGDSISDMIFGKRLGMITVFLSEDLKEIRKGQRFIDISYPGLGALAQALNSIE